MERSAGQVPPHDPEAEASVLGSILLEPRMLDSLAGQLQPEDFYREANAQIFRTAVALRSRLEPIDNVTVAPELERVGVLERVGARAGLASLVESTPTAANALHYAALVRACARRRQLIEAGRQAIRLGHDLNLDVDESVDRAGALLHRVAMLQPQSAASLSSLLPAALDRLGQRQEVLTGVTGVRSGLPALDALTGGWQGGELVIIAARPSVGKSALALAAVRAAAVGQRVPAAVFSLEMSRAMLVDRLLCAEAEVDSWRYGHGRLEGPEDTRLKAALAILAEAPIVIDDRSRLDELTLAAEVRRLKEQKGLGLLVVDYLQLMELRQRPVGGNRVYEVSSISRSLKALARELEIPVLALSQLSRAPELRGDRRPTLADLRESGSLEQDADLVLLLYREDYYLREKAPRPGVVEVQVAKHRNGPTGLVEVRFRRESGRFEDLHQPPARRQEISANQERATRLALEESPSSLSRMGEGRSR